MSKKAFIKEHEQLIKLLEKVNKEKIDQTKELKKVKGGMKLKYGIGDLKYDAMILMNAVLPHLSTPEQKNLMMQYKAIENYHDKQSLNEYLSSMLIPRLQYLYHQMSHKEEEPEGEDMIGKIHNNGSFSKVKGGFNFGRYHFDVNIGHNTRRDTNNKNTDIQLSDKAIKELMQLYTDPNFKISKKVIKELKNIQEALLKEKENENDDEIDDEKIEGSGNIISGAYDAISSRVKAITSRVKAIIYGRDSNPNTRAFLEKHGKDEILGMSICRRPMERELMQVLHWISNGETKKVQENLNYDDLYHLYLKLDLSDGKSYILEKNETIQFINWVDIPNAQCKKITILKPIEMNTFFLNGFNYCKKYNIPFFKYNVVNANCQKFLDSLLDANSDYVDYTEEDKKFILQDVGSILEKSPLAKKFALVALAIKDGLGILYDGAGINKKKKSQK